MSSLGGINQMQHQQSPGQQPPSAGQTSQPGAGIALPSLGQVMMHQPLQGQLDRDARDREARDRQRQDAMLREREATHQINTGSLPIHQPVASNVSTAIHGPGGLLSATSIAPPQYMPSATAPQYEQRQPMQNVPQNAMIHPHGNISSMVPPSQQPILNDALTYLENVKNQLPQKYNEFLDIMKDFKSQAYVTNSDSKLTNSIDTPGVIDRVSNLFSGHPQLVQGFNTFLPVGYRIECGSGDDPNAIRVTTPSGTTVQTMNGQNGQKFPPYQEQIRPYAPNPMEMNQVPGLRPPAERFPIGGPNVTTLANAPQYMGDKKSPVEFNHAINYVNKIKNRFQQQPEIYKNFLEILQTYQREARPIHDVYAQVTQLFSSAPDLLEDFKQFLPESAANPKPKSEAKLPEETSNVRGEASYAAGAQQFQAPARMPAIGNFAPPAPPSSKKRPRTGPVPPPVQSPAVNKKPRLNQPRPADMPSVSPSLTPALPEPLAPLSRELATAEEAAFFEKVKKFVSNKQTYSEFLKLCNLFAQDLIDKNVLVSRASCFIGTNLELMNWFKKFVGYDGRDEIIENVPRNNGRVALSNCRGLGPSYRLLPKGEQLQVCSGRDDLCDSVLNDQWASHPTWASEESGFQAHRKNQYEECLHRIEEERHDYDFNIESNQRVIQLLEPIAQRIAVMSPEELESFTLQPGLGGQSIAIPVRVIKKIYGREKGTQVVEKLYSNPAAVVPVLLKRLRERDLMWQTSRRAWEVVWRDQVNKVFWKSLDHQGINAKTSDKKLFLTKTLHQEISVIKHEQKRQRAMGIRADRFQLKYKFADAGVIADASRLIATFIEHTVHFNAGDRQKIDVFIKAFVPLFFGLSLEEDEKTTRKSDMLRSVLDRSRVVKTRREDSTPGSKETTPEASSDEVADLAGEKWTKGSKNGEITLPDGAYSMNELFERSEYSLYGNNTIYTFFRLFQVLYIRLSHFKEREETIVRDVRERNEMKPANELKLIDKAPSHYFKDPSEAGSFYSQVLQMCEDIVSSNMESSFFEEALRLVYIDVGWELFSIEKLLTGICRMAHLIISSDSKDKSNDMIHLFMKDRNTPKTTFAEEIDYRRAVEKLSKDEVYRIGFVRSKYLSTANKQDEKTREATVQWLEKSDVTFHSDGLSPQQGWSYYVSSFVRMQPTEGVPVEKVNLPFLKRSLPSSDVDSDLGTADFPDFLPVRSDEELVCRINPNGYKIYFEPNTTDTWIHADRFRLEDGETDSGKKRRAQVFKDKFELRKSSSGKASPATTGEVEEETRVFENWIKNGVLPDGRAASQVDEVMADAEAY